MPVISHFVGSLDVTVGTSWVAKRSEDFTNFGADGALPSGLKFVELAVVNKHGSNSGYAAGFEIDSAAAKTSRVNVAAGAALTVELDGSSEVASFAGSGAGTTLLLIAKFEA